MEPSEAGKRKKAEDEINGGDPAAAPKRPTTSLMPGLDARRIFLRDGAAGDTSAGTAALDFSKRAAAARPGPAELLTLAAKVRSGDLTSLNLANNDLSTEAALALARALGEPSCALVSLGVRGNWSTMDDDDPEEPAVGVALAAALGSSRSLTELDAGGNNLWGREVGAAFADALRPGCSLVALDLQGCAIGDSGCAALTAALKAGSGLTSLSIGWNQLGTGASTALAEALVSPACQLRRLGHWRNNLREAGGKAIAAALTSPHCHLVSLILGLTTRHKIDVNGHF